MKAIIHITQEGVGSIYARTRVSMYGCGNNEQQARVRAQDHVSGGVNWSEEEFQGGTLVDVSKELVELLSEEGSWQDDFDESGALVGSHCTQKHVNCLYALGNLIVNAAGELDYTRRPPEPHERDNTLELTGDMLLRPIGELFALVENRPNRKGLPRMSYRDQYDHFAMRIERTTRGYTVSCMLNGSMSYQLNTKFFDRRLPIGVPMLYAANVKFNPFDDAREIAKFFELNTTV